MVCDNFRVFSQPFLKIENGAKLVGVIVNVLARHPND
jgi:hypothetical protein